MFDELASQGPTPGQRVGQLVAGAIRGTVPRIVLGVLALAVGGLSLSGAWAVEAAGPEACMELQQAEFTLDELIATKDKVIAYEQEPVGELVLSGKEASFVLADNLHYPVWVETRGSELYVQFALPEQDACYNIRFQGTVEVDAGRAHVVPTTVKVGGLDISPFVAGRSFDAGPNDLTGEEARQLLRQTKHLRVVDDVVHVAVTNPRSLR